MRAQRWPVVGSRVRLAGAILALGALVPTAVAPTGGTLDAAERHPAFSLAILRRDGILIPFAVYDGKHWKNPWPAPDQTSDMPITVAEIPKGWWHDKQHIMDWRLLPLGRDQSNATVSTRTAHVNGINWFLAGCQRGVGLRTDYKPAILPPPPRMHPYPKDALAFAGDVTIAPIEIVHPTDAVAASLAKQLPDAITPKEDLQVSHYTRGNWVHSYSARERKEVHVDLEALYRVRHALDGHDVYYFEAVKRYFLPKIATAPAKRLTAKDEPTCDLVTFATGWFTTDAAGIIGDLSPRVIVTSCDYQHIAIMLPLGTITVEGKMQWIVQWSNPTFESYAIMQPTESLMKPKDERRDSDVETLLESTGGTCLNED